MASRFETVADLHREGCSLTIICKRCRRGSSWDADLVMRRYFRDAPYTPADMAALPIAEVIAKVKCRQCGGKQAEWFPQKRGAQPMAG